MSKKLLTKTGWEAQLRKEGVEDKTLGKALAAYEKSEDLDSLQAVEKAAAALKKQKEMKPVADYLEEVLEAAAEARAELEKSEKEGEESEGGEEGEMEADLGKQLKGALAKVKAAAPEEGVPLEEGRPQMKFLAYSAGRSCALVVARKVGSATKKLVAGLTGGAGGKYLSGDCIFEKNAYTFVMESPSGGLAKKFSKALLAETGQKYKVRVRSLDGSMELDDETDVAEDEAAAAAPEAKPAGEIVSPLARLQALKPDLDKILAGAVSSSTEARKLFVAVAGMIKGGQLAEAQTQLPALEAILAKGLAELAGRAAPVTEADAEAAFKARLTALLPKVKEALGAGGALAQEIKLKAGEAGALGRQKDFAQANTLLDQVERLLGGAKPGANPQEAFKARVAALMPAIKQAIAAGTPAGQSIRLKAGEAAALGKQNDFVRGNAALDEVEVLLEQPGSSTAGGAKGTDGKNFSIVALQGARLKWNGLRNQLQSDLKALEKSVLDGVRAHNADEEAEDEFEEPEVVNGVKQLYEALAKFDDRLITKLDQGLTATTDEERKARHEEAAVLIKEYQGFAQSDPVLAAIDQNGFISSNIRTSVVSTLTDLAAQF